MFRTQDLRDSLELLADHGLLVESGAPANGAALDGDGDDERMAPQVNLFHDLAPGVAVQHGLSAATVAVVGLGGAGPATALALAAAGVGALRCVDWAPVAPADLYLSPFLGPDRLGAGRAAATADLVRAAAPGTEAIVADRPLDSEDDLRSAVDGADVVVCCLDASYANLVFKLNRVCLADGRRWLTCALAGAEVVVGPVMHPGRSACYLCYRMRVVACAGNPEDAFAYERYLDGRKRDDSARRENLVFGAGLVANLVGLEVVKLLTDVMEPSLVGRILTVRLADLAVRRHTVLRKPWCPACFSPEQADPPEGGDAGAG